MEKQQISFTLTLYEDRTDLPEALQGLLKAAEDSRENAYAPYSNFKVGAAVLLNNGEVVIGNNQENASSPSGLCAERVAIFHAGARFPGVSIKAVAVSAASSKGKVDKPATPCGNCRQSMSEYEYKQKSPIEIVMAGETGPVYHCSSISDLLPLPFNNSDLK